MSFKSCDMVYHGEPLSEYASEVFDWPAGHFAFSSPDKDGTLYLHMVLPVGDGDGKFCCIPVKTGPKESGAWQWDGNREKPTLTPSVWHHSTPDWHGWITAGRMVGC